MRLDTVTSDDFKPLLNGRFLIIGDASTVVQTELIQVKDLPMGYEDDLDEENIPLRRRPFSLIFRSAQRDEYLPQRIYTVENDQIGRLDIFLVPIGADKTGMRYQAIFN